MATSPTDITVVGHFSADSIILPSKSTPYAVLGGSVAYVSLIAKRLHCTASVISKVGNDFPEAYLEWLTKENIDVSAVNRVPNVPTTRFELTYAKDFDQRSLKLKSKAPPLTVSDVPASLKAIAVHVAPIAQEVPLEVVEHLKGCCEVLSLDPQGMTRSFDQDGNVSCCTSVDKRIVSLVDVYKSSVDEIIALTELSEINSAIKAVHDLGPKIVIATKGAKGSTLSVEGNLREVPACVPAKVFDPTGAGDVFIGAFLAEYIRRQEEPWWCACVGSAAASFVVEDVGPACMGKKAEIYRRAKSVYKTR